jgi:tetratricopeptide (TPR) repeat protein
MTGSGGLIIGLHACSSDGAGPVSVNGQDAEAYHGLAILELLAHRHERALRAAQRAIELNENFHPGFFALGETRIFMGDFAEGLEPIGHCLRLSPTDPFSPVFVSLPGTGRVWRPRHVVRHPSGINSN